MKHRLSLLVLLILGACAATVPGNYAVTQSIALESRLPPPPAAGSKAEQEDIAAVLAAQKSRTPEQIRQAREDAALGIAPFLAVLGDELTPERLPVTAAFLAKVRHDEGAAVEALKERYNRPRPYAADARVHPVVPQPRNASYPSGHTVFGYVMAGVLAHMAPEYAAPLTARAALYGQNRVIGGVHYPTDVAAGKQAAGIIVESLMKDPAFLRDLRAARQELRRALKKG